MNNDNKVVCKNLDSKERIKSFKEVSLGYTKEEAIQEASRCLNCKKPLCVTGCPVNVNIPVFINYIKNDDVQNAYNEILKQNSFPGICGRVCPQEKQCEGKCIKGIKGESIAIGKLERYTRDSISRDSISRDTISRDTNSRVDNSSNVNEIKKNGKKIAIVGSGPAGLSCASTAVNLGYDVTIYEALHKAGGVLSYGIPEFRLPKDIVDSEIKALIDKGVNIRTNYVIGKIFSIEELKHDYDAIFIGSGAGTPKFMNIPGENFNGVFSANEFLTRVNLMKGYTSLSDSPVKKMINVAVIGGGNVAMDAARCAKRLGANVYLIYRRSIEEMPARKEELEHALEEDIDFQILTNPVEILSNDGINVSQIRCKKMELTLPDQSGRRGVKETEKVVTFDVDSVIMAIGNYPNPLLKDNDPNLIFTSKGLIEVDDNNESSIPMVYAGGDIVTGAATVILAMGAGKKALLAIHKKLFPDN